MLDETENHLSLTLEGQPLARLRLERGDELHVHWQQPGEVPSARALWAACVLVVRQRADPPAPGLAP